MKKIDVKIEGSGRRRRAQRRPVLPLARARNLLRAVMLRPRLMTAGALIGGVLAFGTPHVGWDYQCAHSMRGIGTCEEARWCAYYGVQGRRLVFPESGEICDLVKFIRIDWRKLWDDLGSLAA